MAIDHLLVEQSSDGVIQLSDGCLCCTVRGELVDTLADLVDRLQTGRIARLKRVIIETTGLADPAPVLQSIMGHPALVQAFRLDGVIALVDAVNGGPTLDRPCRSDQAGRGRRPYRLDQGRSGGRRGKSCPRFGSGWLEVQSVRAGPRRPRLRVRRRRSVRLRPLQSFDQVSRRPPLAGRGGRACRASCLGPPRPRSSGPRSWAYATTAGENLHLVHDAPVPYSTIEMFLDLLRRCRATSSCA